MTFNPLKRSVGGAFRGNKQRNWEYKRDERNPNHIAETQ